MNFRPRLSLTSISNPEGLLWQSSLAIATAVLLVVSFPNFNLAFFAWVALAPLLSVLARGVSVRRALWLGWLAGLIFTFTAENWISHSMTRYGGLPAIVAYGIALLFAAILAWFPSVFAGAMTWLIRCWGWRALTLVPAVWVATEYLRPLVTGVTWNALGISQVSHFNIARTAQFGGVYLVSAEVVAVSALLVLLLKAGDRVVLRSAALLLLGAATPLLLPSSPSPPGPTITFVGVQPNLPPDTDQMPDAFARDLENNIKLTREAINRAPNKAADVVVWSESPLALFYENDAALREKLDALARDTGSHFILNTVTRDANSYTNSIHTISPQPGKVTKPLRRYDKIRLVPFGEYVPLRPLLGHFVPAMIGDFTPGVETVVNTLRLETKLSAVVNRDEAAFERTTDFVRIGSFICYEAAYPQLVRGFVKNGAGILVNVSNDAWFGTTAGAHQHLAHAAMRAIENDRDLVRVTNAGISALITAEGHVIDPLPMFASRAQVWQAQVRRQQTFYTRHGDWFALACVIVSATALGISFFRSKRP